MNLRRRRKHNIEVSTHSLNDIMFFLLLFFLIASTLTNPTVIKLLLPKASSGSVISKKNISVQIDNREQLYVENAALRYEDLPKELQLLSKQYDGAATVVLFADKTVQVEYIVKVLDACQRVGLKVVLATEKVKAPSAIELHQK